MPCSWIQQEFDTGMRWKDIVIVLYRPGDIDTGTLIFVCALRHKEAFNCLEPEGVTAEGRLQEDEPVGVVAEGRFRGEEPGGAAAEERPRERDPALHMWDAWRGA
jgi:hypothetical protein